LLSVRRWLELDKIPIAKSGLFWSFIQFFLSLNWVCFLKKAISNRGSNSNSQERGNSFAVKCETFL
jgi:hypothetical protein